MYFLQIYKNIFDKNKMNWYKVFKKNLDVFSLSFFPQQNACKCRQHKRYNYVDSTEVGLSMTNETRKQGILSGNNMFNLLLIQYYLGYLRFVGFRLHYYVTEKTLKRYRNIK